MQPHLVHFCRVCTYNTPVVFSASVFSQPQSCSHCGSTSDSINVRSGEEEKDNMQQDELAALFSQRLTFSQTPVSPPPVHHVEQPPAQAAFEQQTEAPIRKPIVYASVHYYQPVSIAPKPEPQQPIAPARTELDASLLEGIFLRNNIDPRHLSPSQVTLFHNADDDQRLRLLELWRISPPEYGGNKVYWPQTSLQQEEEMAKRRYERLEQQKKGLTTNHMIHVDEQPMEHGYGAKPAEEVNAEPYMLSGYEQLAARDYHNQPRSLSESKRYNQAVDPVYRASTGLWDKSGLQDMENKYGAYEQMTYRDEDMVL